MKKRFLSILAIFLLTGCFESTNQNNANPGGNNNPDPTTPEPEPSDPEPTTPEPEEKEGLRSNLREEFISLLYLVKSEKSFDETMMWDDENKSYFNSFETNKAQLDACLEFYQIVEIEYSTIGSIVEENAIYTCKYTKDNTYFLLVEAIVENNKTLVTYNMSFDSAFTFVDDGGQSLTTTNYTQFYDGTFIGQLDQPAKREELASYINEGTTLVENVLLVGKSEAKSLKMEDLSMSAHHVCWWIGSSSETGTLTLDFNYEIKSIKLTVQAYNKPYVDTWSDPENDIFYPNYDSNAKLFIDDENTIIDLSFDKEDELPPVIKHKKEYSTPVNSITLGNFDVGERVFIHSIEIVYYN